VNGKRVRWLVKSDLKTAGSEEPAAAAGPDIVLRRMGEN
jgi:hypothetical protein